MNFIDFQKSQREELMPSGDKLASEAQKLLHVEKIKIQQRFNTYLKQLLAREFQLYLKYEQDCTGVIIDKAIRKGLLQKTNTTSDFFRENYEDIWGMFLSISQSRRTRAGGSFERHVSFLFNILEYPYEKQKILNGKVDYVIPSVAAFKKNRTSCVVISVKRTLRERWRQVVGELASIKAGKIYILTADEDISGEKVKEMSGQNVNLVIWDEYKKKKFSTQHNVLGFTEFVKVHLPSSKKLWENLV